MGHTQLGLLTLRKQTPCLRCMYCCNCAGIVHHAGSSVGQQARWSWWPLTAMLTLNTLANLTLLCHIQDLNFVVEQVLP